MASKRNLASSFAVTATLLVLGCQPASQSDRMRDSEAALVELDDATKIQMELDQAKALSQRGNHDTAAKSLYSLMIRHPDNDDAILLTAQVEAARGDLETALEVIRSVNADSKVWPAAIDLHAQLLAKRGRHGLAADLLLDALVKQQDRLKWRHEAWRLLNFVGRRQEACDQAMALCRLGLATEPELLSLIGRRLAFPSPDLIKDKGATPQQIEKQFAPGLGKARWFYSVQQYDRALEQLERQRRDGFASVADEAFYGRLLAESQHWEAFQSWHSQRSLQIERHSDYWSALGTFYIDARDHESAVRALLESIVRDPTDRESYQRLAKVLAAIDRPEDSEQFRNRGIEIAQTERLAKEVLESPTDVEKREQLARYLMELGRPFETLAWTSTMLPRNALAPRQMVSRQRVQLLQDPSAATMTTEIALLGLAPSQFRLQPLDEQRLGNRGVSTAETTVPPRAVATTPRLVNRADELNLAFQWYKDVEIDLTTIPIHESLGGGIAVLDYDLDGWPDVYLAQGSGDPPTDRCTRSNELYRHLNSTFQTKTVPANAEDHHYSSGLAAGDVNQDGFPDLLLGSLGHNRLLINNGDGTFQEQTERLGEFPDRFTASVAIADINGDRLPDLFESNYIEMEGGFALPKTGPDGKLISPTPLAHYPDADRWFENLGDGTFRLHEITRSIAKPGTSLGLVVTDFQSDGKNEVFVGIDVRPNHLLVQDGNNSFLNLADTNGLANGLSGVANGCMGIATGDFNRDGRLDLQIANYSLEPANLYLQNASGDFTDHSMRYGLAAVTNPFVGFGTKAADFDRNGFLDFIVTNGHIFDMRDQGEPYQMAPQLLMSDGRSLELVDVEDESGYWDKTYLGRTIATLDYDRDGATDFLVGHLDQPLALLHDETRADGRWVQVELIGTTSERDAIGARLSLTVDRTPYIEWVTAGDGYFCSDEPVCSFAFPPRQGDADIHLQVQWPSGRVQDFAALTPGHRYLVVEGQTQPELRW
ncbi:FG-GAP repeat protein [Stieleria maiorica]|uniref:FG-GAP repeat protein n=1 Tax=Stieleria maiorica TaxID=2795974 RepID=A0A5B9MMT1_9BACT|nr:FG-GAP-like repeat-containing protein [Stieleria maiorica]QEG00955.1 FG-GAP repeat protein [Stieleria maiorica]